MNDHRDLSAFAIAIQTSDGETVFGNGYQMKANFHNMVAFSEKSTFSTKVWNLILSLLDNDNLTSSDCIQAIFHEEIQWRDIIRLIQHYQLRRPEAYYRTLLGNCLPSIYKYDRIGKVAEALDSDEVRQRISMIGKVDWDAFQFIEKVSLRASCYGCHLWHLKVCHAALK